MKIIFQLHHCFSVYEHYNSKENRKVLENKLHYSFLSQLSCLYGGYFNPKMRVLNELDMSKTMKIILCHTKVPFSGPVRRALLENHQEF